MDKQTLSNYGWVVVLVLILAVLLALATPFGSFVSTAIKDVTGGFWDVNSVALKGVGISTENVDFPAEPASCGVEGHYIGDDKGEHGIPVEDCKSGHTYTCECDSWVIPEGGIYDSGAYSTTVGKRQGAYKTYRSGEILPCGYAHRRGDVFIYGNYEYKYNFSCNYGTNWKESSSQNGWGVGVIDKTQTSYGEILESIANKPVNNMRYSFYECTSLTTAPVIPNTVTNMKSTFLGCTSLTTAPVIPNSVTDMSQTFCDCTSLTTPPDMSKATNITSMSQTFYGCTSLVNAPVVPNSVVNMMTAFSGCTSLTGTIEINANPTYYNYCFSDVDFKTKNITLTGTSSMLDEIGATGKNYCAVCNGTCSGSH